MKANLLELYTIDMFHLRDEDPKQLKKSQTPDVLKLRILQWLIPTRVLLT